MHHTYLSGLLYHACASITAYQ